MSITSPANMLLPREWILQEIEECLNTIDGTGNYHPEVKPNHVTRDFKPWNNYPADQIPALLIADAGDTVREEAGYHLQRVMDVHVWGYLKPGRSVNRSRDLCYLVEDVVRCLKADKQRQKLASWTRFGDMPTAEGWAGNKSVFRLSVLVAYSYVDPQT